MWFVLVALALGQEPPPRAATADAVMLPNGLALPYPTQRYSRGFQGPCMRSGYRPTSHVGRWRSHAHEGVDLGGFGPDAGVGSAVRSLTHARVVDIAIGAEQPNRCGFPDRRPGCAIREGREQIRSFELAGYGEVFFLTHNRGEWQTGNMVVTRGIDGPLARHTIRYLHLGAPRPDLQVGDVVLPGEEVGVLGGTGVQWSAPHVHIDIFDPDYQGVDVAPLLGLAPTAICGLPRQRALRDAELFAAAAGTRARQPVRWAPPVGAPGVGVGGRVLPWIDLAP